MTRLNEITLLHQLSAAPDETKYHAARRQLLNDFGWVSGGHVSRRPFSPHALSRGQVTDDSLFEAGDDIVHYRRGGRAGFIVANVPTKERADDIADRASRHFGLKCIRSRATLGRPGHLVVLYGRGEPPVLLGCMIEFDEWDNS
jgi:hypothetical protein